MNDQYVGHLIAPHLKFTGIRNLRLMANIFFHFLSCESVLICLLSANRREAKIDTHLPDAVFIISGGIMIFKLPIVGI